MTYPAWGVRLVSLNLSPSRSKEIHLENCPSLNSAFTITLAQECWIVCSRTTITTNKLLINFKPTHFLFCCSMLNKWFFWTNIGDTILVNFQIYWTQFHFSHTQCYVLWRSPDKLITHWFLSELSYSGYSFKKRFLRATLSDFPSDRLRRRTQLEWKCMKMNEWTLETAHEWL